jgi:AAA+ superfamily predicted ATPase
VESLIGSHQSLERCLIQVQMPRMSDEESLNIIEKGLSKLELKINEDVKSKIVEFSSGFPHYIHLLCKYCVLHVIDQNKEYIDNDDLNVAILKGIDSTNGQLQTSYRNML